MVNQELINKLKAWQEDPPTAETADEKFGIEFLTTLFTLFKELSEEDDDLKEEVEDSDICLQFIMMYKDQEFKFWISARDGKIDFGIGAGPEVTVTMKAESENMFKLLSGQGDGTSMYMAGDLSIEGNLQDAMSFNGIASIAADLIREAMD